MAAPQTDVRQPFCLQIPTSRHCIYIYTVYIYIYIWSYGLDRISVMSKVIVIYVGGCAQYNQRCSTLLRPLSILRYTAAKSPVIPESEFDL